MNAILAFLQKMVVRTADQEELLADTIALLKPEEGYRRFPYTDTVGKVTIGYGFNLTDVGLYPEEADFMMKFRTQKSINDVITSLPWSADLTTQRRVVLSDMAYNLGIEGLMKFTGFLGYLKDGNYQAASADMLMSKWATQVGHRAQVLASMIRNG